MLIGERKINSATYSNIVAFLCKYDLPRKSCPFIRQLTLHLLRKVRLHFKMKNSDQARFV